MKKLDVKQMENVNGGGDGCDAIEDVAAVLGLGNLIACWIPVVNGVYAILTSPVVIAGAMCHFFGD